MARSRISENQLIDEDVLSEEEHLNFDHSTISGVPNSFLDLTDTPSEYDNDKLLISTESGVNFTDNVGYTGQVVVISPTSPGSGVYIENFLAFENGVLTTVSGGNEVDLLPSGSTFLTIN